jgi:predicted O-linked N-acetylglucosamine transferase (SPINDLY family)
MSKNKPKKPAKFQSVRHHSPGRLPGPRPEEIEALITLFDRGIFVAAAAAAQRMTEQYPGFLKGWMAYADIMERLGNSPAAVTAREKAVTLSPQNPALHASLGRTLRIQGRLEEAEVCYRKAISCKPDAAPAYYDLANVLAALGRPEDAESLERQALQLNPASALGHNNLGTTLRSLGRMAEARACFEEALKIDPDFPDAHVGLGATHYSLGQLEESEACFRHALQMLPTHNRLPLFAWKPAPVQVSWLGYFATTGVAEIDYFIADPHTLPAGEGKQFTETVWRLPDTRLCFTAPDADVAVAELPALTNGHITFGCFNSLTKINDRVIALWARLLDAVPGSRLMLKAKQLKEALVQDKMRERFAAHGVAADHLLLEGPEARAEYLAAYNRIDIALDPFPFTGGTTTAECLWMGVPVLTLAGDRLVSRQGVGLLANAGLPDWIATDADDYVGKAALHASNPQALAALRRSLRQQVLASPVFDGERFARHLEKALHDMWDAQ